MSSEQPTQSGSATTHEPPQHRGAPGDVGGGEPIVELVIVGGGNMGTALLGGLLNGGPLGAHQVAVVEANQARREALEAEYPGVRIDAAVPPAVSAIVAVKPQHVAAALAATNAAGIRRVLSIAAGVTTAAISAITGPDVAVVRAMPNTPALVQRGVTAIAAGPGADDSDMAWARSMLDGVGLVVEVDEPQLDAVTGLTGSGPAYLFLVVESLIDAGVGQGLELAMVSEMVTQLLEGTAALLRQHGDPASLRRAVTSPGGTTEAGLKTLVERQVPAAFIEAVASATRRSRELGRAS